MAKPELIQVRPLRARAEAVNPAVPLLYSFVLLIGLGTAVLLLPISTADGTIPPLHVAIFTAVSAATVTGLVVVDTATYWSSFGHVAILTMIQVGGFGIMTSSALLLILIGRRASLRERLVLGHALGGSPIGTAVQVARRVAVATLVIETVGAALLMARFVTLVPPDQALWWSVFHAVSGFNHAGFDLMGGFHSLGRFQNDGFVLGIFMVLVMLGAMGYFALADLTEVRGWRRLSLDTKLVLGTNAILWVLGALVILLLEARNPLTLGSLAPVEAAMNAAFLSVSARSAGFATFDLAAARDPTLLWIMGLMFIGGAAGSVAGGIKVNTFSTLFFAILSTVRGMTHVEAFGREIPQVQVYRALSVALLGIGVVFLVSLLLDVVEGSAFVPLFFDAISAAGTVGLSTGVTHTASVPGQLLLAATIFIGRLGPLTLVLALSARERVARYRLAEEQVKIG